LKRRKKDTERPAQQCAVTKCSAVSAVVDATGRFEEGPVPFCEHHWVKRCNEVEAEFLAKSEEEKPAPSPGVWVFEETPNGLRAIR
jgi:hypothetical protein